MKKILGTVIGLILISVLVTFASPSRRDERYWQWATAQGTAESFAEYLQAWPEGKHATEAKALYDEKGWQDANTTNSVQAFEHYLAEHPDGKYVAQANESIEDLHWQTASTSLTAGALETYLRDYPNGKYLTQARGRIEELDWQTAAAANTIAACNYYLKMYPSGRFLKEAKVQIAALTRDNAPFLAADQQGTRTAYETFLAQFPGHKREADARSALKDIVEGADIVDLLTQRKIETKTQGSGITNVSLEIRRLVHYEVTVRVPVGTFFVSRNSSAQNMVTTREEMTVLTNNQWVSISVSAACANRPRDIPGNDDSFTVQRSPQQKELTKLMPVLQKAAVSTEVEQAAVWIITDNADYDDLGTLVRGFGGFGSRVILEGEAAQAMKIIDSAGIDIKTKAIWEDREIILRELADKDLQAWLRGKTGR